MDTWDDNGKQKTKLGGRWKEKKQSEEVRKVLCNQKKWPFWKSFSKSYHLFNDHYLKFLENSWKSHPACSRIFEVM